MKYLVIAILFALLIYVCLLTFVYFKQESFIFYPERLPDEYPFSEFPNASELYFNTPNEGYINALHFKPIGPSKGMILYFHGNARAIDQWGYMASEFTDRGYELIMPDYRSYGKSKGPFSENNLKEDGIFIKNWIEAQYQPSKLIVYGRSLGSGIASYVAAHSTCDLLILETPYLSILKLAAQGMWYLPVSHLLRFHFRTDLLLPDITCPIYIFHGTEDELIPYADAVALSTLNAKAKMITIPQASHNNLSDFELFHQQLNKILN